jgi:hypothetical protein
MVIVFIWHVFVFYRLNIIELIINNQLDGFCHADIIGNEIRMTNNEKVLSRSNKTIKSTI